MAQIARLAESELARLAWFSIDQLDIQPLYRDYGPFGLDRLRGITD
jgi:hypothetical protein